MRSAAAAQRDLTEKDWLSQGLGAPAEAEALDSCLFCCRYSFEPVSLVPLGWSIELTLEAGPLLLETGKSELLGWGWQRLPETERLH